MSKFSKKLLVIYTAIPVIYLFSNYLVTSLVLLLLAISLIAIIISTFKLVSYYRTKSTRREYIKSIIILIIPVVFIFAKREINLQKNITLLAYSDLVISGAEIIFYGNNKVKYCSSDLIGEKYYFGDYTQADDTIYVSYKGETPPIKSNKMIQIINKLVFLDERDSAIYKFNIDQTFSK